MKVLFAITEIGGLYKIGGLGDVGLELPLALINLGIEVELIIPKFHNLEFPQGYQHFQTNRLLFGDNLLEYRIINGKHPYYPELSINIVEENDYISSSQHDDAKRYGVFCLAVVDWLKNSDLIFDIIHVNDWHTGLIPLMLKRNQIFTKSIFTIHNILYQGIAPAGIARELNLPTSWSQLSWDIQNGDINFLLEGIMYCDKLTTVSPQYALEIQTPELGEGLDKIVKENSHKLTGILNGISWKNWNPETDEALQHKYNINNYKTGKLKAKEQLEALLGIDRSKNLFAYIGRADRRQKGIQLILELIDTDWPNDCHLIMLSQGDPELELEMRVMESKHPKILTVINRFDEKLSRIIYAGSDFALIPSRFEPCGLVQLIAMRYGTIPIARKTGGLTNTVFNNVNGFVFENYVLSDFVQSVRNAINTYQTESDRLISSAMKFDSTWDKSAVEYKKIYDRLNY